MIVPYLHVDKISNKTLVYLQNLIYKNYSILFSCEEGDLEDYNLDFRKIKILRKGKLYRSSAGGRFLYRLFECFVNNYKIGDNLIRLDENYEQKLIEFGQGFFVAFSENIYTLSYNTARLILNSKILENDELLIKFNKENGFNDSQLLQYCCKCLSIKTVDAPNSILVHNFF